MFAANLFRGLEGYFGRRCLDIDDFAAPADVEGEINIELARCLNLKAAFANRAKTGGLHFQTVCAEIDRVEAIDTCCISCCATAYVCSGLG